MFSSHQILKHLSIVLLCLVLPVSSRANDKDEQLDAMADQLALLSELVASQQIQIEDLNRKLLVLKQEESTAPAKVVETVPVIAQPSVEEKKKWKAEIYGYVKLDAAYDTQRTAPGNFALFVHPLTNGQSDDEFNLTARETRLGFKIKGDVLPDFKSMARLEMDFCGSASETSPSPRLRLAYMKIEKSNWEILAGQDWDTYISILPKSLNFATYGYHGSLWSRRPQLRLKRSGKVDESSWSVSAAIARTVGTDLDCLGQEDGKDYAFPTFQFKADFRFPMNGLEGLVSVGGIYGTETLDTLEGIDSRNYVSRMLTTSLRFPINEKLSLSSTLWAGQNLGSYMGGIGQGINLDKDTEIASKGGWVQLGYSPVAYLNTYLTYGVDDPADEDLNVGQRSKNQNLSASLYWGMSDYVTWGFEYSSMTTYYLEMLEAHNNRYQSAFIFKY